MGKKDRNFYNAYDEYDDYDTSSGGYVVKKALAVFLLTLAIVLGVGLPALLLVNNRQNGPMENHMENSFASKWEKIPEADKVVEPVVTLDENDEPEIIIPVEDAEYTHFIDTLNDDCVTIGFAG